MVDPAHFQRLYRAARAEGPEALAAFVGLCDVYSSLANRALCESLEPERRQAVERNLPPAVAAERLGIALRKLTRARFTVYREICIPIEGQTRGYTVSERALDAHLARQRSLR